MLNRSSFACPHGQRHLCEWKKPGRDPRREFRFGQLEQSENPEKIWSRNVLEGSVNQTYQFWRLRELRANQDVWSNIAWQTVL